MKKSINKKIIATIVLMIMIFTNIINIFPLLKSYATNNEIGDRKYIESVGTVEYHLKSRGVSSRRICYYSFSWIPW